MPVAKARLPPPLSPAMMIRPTSTFSFSAFAASQYRPLTQSFKPAGNGATSGAEDGVSALRKSTIATATPRPAMTRPQAR